MCWGVPGTLFSLVGALVQPETKQIIEDRREREQTTAKPIKTRGNNQKAGRLTKGEAARTGRDSNAKRVKDNEEIGGK